MLNLNRMTIASFGAALFMAVCFSSAPALAFGEQAVAEVKDGAGKALGTIKLTETTAGILFDVSLTGLPPGRHAIHIHDTGTCEGDFTSAGGIYNPFGANHGYLDADGPMSGDLANIITAENGKTDAELVSSLATLQAEAVEPLLDDNGASIVIFEKADDYKSQPEGNAGARIACGVIKAEKK